MKTISQSIVLLVFLLVKSFSFVSFSQPGHSVQLQPYQLQTPINIQNILQQPQNLVMLSQDGTTDTVSQSLQQVRITRERPFVYSKVNRVLVDTTQLPAGSEVIGDKLFKTLVVTPSGATQEVYFQLVVIETDRIAFDPADRVWRGVTRVICKPTIASSQELRLVSPMPLMIRAIELIVAEDSVEFLNREKELVMMLNETENVYDTLNFTARFQNETELFSRYALVRPYLRISASRKSILGYSLDKTDIRIVLTGTKHHSRIKVLLNATEGILQPDEVELSGENPIGRVTLISEGRGGSVVKSEISGFIYTTAEVNFTTPWRMLIFALLGAFGGTLIRLFNKKKEEAMVKSMIAGTLTGLLMVLAYFGLGLNLFVIKIDIGIISEITVLALSALGGYLGSINLKMLTKGTGAP